jgi:hypothetical protein
VFYGTTCDHYAGAFGQRGYLALVLRQLLVSFNSAKGGSGVCAMVVVGARTGQSRVVKRCMTHVGGVNSSMLGPAVAEIIRLFLGMRLTPLLFEWTERLKRQFGMVSRAKQWILMYMPYSNQDIGQGRGS